MWIIGYSIIYWQRDMWLQVAGMYSWPDGMVNIRWMSCRRMSSSQFMPVLWQQIRARGPPNVLVRQLVENDLPGVKGLDLTYSIKAD